MRFRRNILDYLSKQVINRQSQQTRFERTSLRKCVHFELPGNAFFMQHRIFNS